jgi:hypothetical protein
MMITNVSFEKLLFRLLVCCVFSLNAITTASAATMGRPVVDVNVVNSSVPVTVNNGSDSPVLVRNVDNEVTEPYQKSLTFNKDSSTCLSNLLLCQAIFPSVPDGKRLVITYASAKFALSSGGTAANAFLSKDGDVGFGDLLILPAPVSIGLNSYIASGPVTFYLEAGETPTVNLGGQFMSTSHSAQATISGYLISVP